MMDLKQALEITVKLAYEAIARIETEGSEPLSDRDHKQAAIDRVHRYVDSIGGGFIKEGTLP